MPKLLSAGLLIPVARTAGSSTPFATLNSTVGFVKGIIPKNSLDVSASVVFTLVLLGLLFSITALADEPGYKVINTYKIGGEGGWDYLIADAAARRLYISRSTHVIVLDLDSGKTVGDIADTPGVHGIALAPQFGRGFTSNGREGTVSIFDLKTLATSSKVKVGDNPDSIIYDAATKRVFTFNGRSQDSTAIDAATGKVLGTIKLDGKPEFSASDGKGEIFVNIEDKSELTVIDPRNLVVKTKWPLAPCESPSGLSMDRKNRRLFVGCDNKMMAVVDADTGKILATPPIGEGVDATAFDDETGLAFASCGEGMLTVVHEESPDKFSVAENVPTQPGARTMALDSKTHDVFVVTAKFGPSTATTDSPHSRRSIVPDTFVVLVLGR
jgi:DNA-binding beta-propeller fold protein YncE